jgi:hypothetical protein
LSWRGKETLPRRFSNTEAPQDGELLATHRALLIQLRETARDRVQLCTLTPSDRAMYRAAKVDEKVGADQSGLRSAMVL